MRTFMAALLLAAGGDGGWIKASDIYQGGDLLTFSNRSWRSPVTVEIRVTGECKVIYADGGGWSEISPLCTAIHKAMLVAP